MSACAIWAVANVRAPKRRKSQSIRQAALTFLLRHGERRRTHPQQINSWQGLWIRIRQLNVSFYASNIMAEFKAVCDEIRQACAQLPPVPAIDAEVC